MTNKGARSLNKQEEEQLITTIALSGLLFSLAGTASAKPYKHNKRSITKERPIKQAKQTIIKQRQVKQQNRIEQVIQNGQLTGREVRKLEKQQFEIQKTKRRALRDGFISKREFRELTLLQDRASKTIYEKKPISKHSVVMASGTNRSMLKTSLPPTSLLKDQTQKRISLQFFDDFSLSITCAL